MSKASKHKKNTVTSITTDTRSLGSSLIKKSRFESRKSTKHTSSLAEVLRQVLESKSKKWNYSNKQSKKLVEKVMSMLSNQSKTNDQNLSHFLSFGSNLFQTLSNGIALMTEPKPKSKESKKGTSTKDKKHRVRQKTVNAYYKNIAESLQVCPCGLFLPNNTENGKRNTKPGVHNRSCPICSWMLRCVFVSITTDNDTRHLVYTEPSGRLSDTNDGRAIDSLDNLDDIHPNMNDDDEDDDDNESDNEDSKAPPPTMIENMISKFGDWDEENNIKDYTEEEAESKISQDECKIFKLAIDYVKKPTDEMGQKHRKKKDQSLYCLCCGKIHKIKPAFCKKGKELRLRAFMELFLEINATSLIQCLHSRPRILKLIQSFADIPSLSSWTFSYISLPKNLEYELERTDEIHHSDHFDPELPILIRTQNTCDPESKYLWDCLDKTRSTFFRFESQSGKKITDHNPDDVYIQHMTYPNNKQNFNDTELRLVFAILFMDRIDTMIDMARLSQNTELVDLSNVGKKRMYSLDFWIKTRYLHLLVKKIRSHYRWGTLLNLMHHNPSQVPKKVNTTSLLAKNSTTNGSSSITKKKKTTVSSLHSRRLKNQKRIISDNTTLSEAVASLDGDDDDGADKFIQPPSPQREIDAVMDIVGKEIVDEEDSNYGKETESLFENNATATTTTVTTDELSDDDDERMEFIVPEAGEKESDDDFQHLENMSLTDKQKIRRTMSVAQDMNLFGNIQVVFYDLFYPEKQFTPTELKSIDLFWNLNNVIASTFFEFATVLERTSITHKDTATKKDKGNLPGDIISVDTTYVDSPQKVAELLGRPKMKGNTSIMHHACVVPSIFMQNVDSSESNIVFERIRSLSGKILKLFDTLLLSSANVIDTAKSDSQIWKETINSMFETLTWLFDTNKDVIINQCAKKKNQFLSSLFPSSSNMDTCTLEEYYSSLEQLFITFIHDKEKLNLKDKFDCIFEFLKRRWLFFPSVKRLHCWFLSSTPKNNNSQELLDDVLQKMN